MNTDPQVSSAPQQPVQSNPQIAEEVGAPPPLPWDSIGGWAGAQAIRPPGSPELPPSVPPGKGPLLVPLAPNAKDTRPAFTIGRGLVGNPTGTRKHVGDDALGSLTQWLRAHRGENAWLSPHTWTGNRRKKSKWEGSIAVFVDLDCKGHGVLTEDLATRALAGIGDLPNLLYLTPHGIRAIFVLEASVHKSEEFIRLADGASALLQKGLDRSGITDLEIDARATRDVARAFYAPSSDVPCKGEHPECAEGKRRAEVLELRRDLWTHSDLRAAVPAPRSGKRSRNRSAQSQRQPAAPGKTGATIVRTKDQLVEALTAEGAKFKGDDLMLHCVLPGHQDKNPSLRFNPAKGCWFCDPCARGGPWEELLELLEPRGIHRGREDRPEIFVRHELNEVPLSELVPRAVGVLANSHRKTLFHRGGKLVRVLPEPGVGMQQLHNSAAHRIEKVDKPTLRTFLDETVWWRTYRRSGKFLCKADTLCPIPVVEAVLSEKVWQGLNPLAGVTGAPVLRSDGSVLGRPGYDSLTGLFYSARREYPEVPEDVNDQVVAEATRTLLEVFSEFGFQSNADRGALVSLMLTMVARHAIHGPVPHWAIMAHSVGTGKTLLAEASAVAMTGAEPRTFAPVGGRRADAEAEMRKRITATLFESPPVVLIDNVDDGSTFESRAFAALLTTVRWSDRELGKSEDLHLLNSAVWVSTGNNYRLPSDLARRSLSIMLDAGVEDPHRRVGFRIKDLLAHVREQHPSLLVAALTILSAFCKAGRPAPGHGGVGKFEAWNALVRGATVWAGERVGIDLDPLPTQDRLRGESPDRSSHEALLQAWLRLSPGTSGMTAKSAIEHASLDEELREAIEEVACGKNGELDSRKLGNHMRTQVGRIVGGLRVVEGGTYQGAKMWRVLSVSSAGKSAPSSFDEGARESGESGESGESSDVVPMYMRAHTGAGMCTGTCDGGSPPLVPDSPESPDSPKTSVGAETADTGVQKEAGVPTQTLAAAPDASPGPRRCRGCRGDSFHRLKGAPQWICSTCHPPAEGARVGVRRVAGQETSEAEAERHE